MRPSADSPAKGDSDLVGDLLRTGQDIRFPESQDGPPVVTQDASLMAIAFNIAPDLRNPVRRVVTSAKLREPSLQISTVPEVTVAEDHQAMFREHDVGAAGQSWNVEAVAKTSAPELTSKGELAAGVRLAAQELQLVCHRSRPRGTSTTLLDISLKHGETFATASHRAPGRWRAARPPPRWRTHPRDPQHDDKHHDHSLGIDLDLLENGLSIGAHRCPPTA